MKLEISQQCDMYFKSHFISQWNLFLEGQTWALRVWLQWGLKQSSTKLRLLFFAILWEITSQLAAINFKVTAIFLYYVRLWQMWEYSLKRREITLKKSNSCGRLSMYLLTSEVKLSTLKLCLRFTVWIEEYKNLTDPELERTSEPLLAKQKKQQGPLTTLYTSKDEAAKSSFVISQIHKNNYNLFSDGEIVKECLMDSAAQIRPEKKNIWNMPLSRWTIIRWIKDSLGKLELQLNTKADNFDFFSLALWCPWYSPFQPMVVQVRQNVELLKWCKIK